MKKSIILLCAITFLALTAGYAGDLKLEPDQQYLLLATTKTSTMQKEVDEAASFGFKIRAGTGTTGAEMVVLLEKVATAPALYQYKLLATTKTSTMDKELNEAGDQGFRLLTDTMTAKQRLIGPVEVVGLLEKAPQTTKRYQYKLLATSRTSTMQKEIREAEAAGFVLVGLCNRGENIVIMEKELE